MSTTAGIGLTGLNFPLSTEVTEALQANRVLFSTVEDLHGNRAMFVIGASESQMRAELGPRALADDAIYLIPVPEWHLRGTQRDRADYEGRAAILDLTGQRAGTIRVHGGEGVSLRTEHGRLDTGVVLIEQIEKGRIFALGVGRQADGSLELVRALEDYSPQGFPVHVLTRTWDTDSEAERQNLTITIAPPATQLVFMVYERRQLLDAIGVAEIAPL